MMTSSETQIAPPAEPSKWPIVIGVFSLLYALGGLLCQAGMGAMSVFGDALMKMQGGNISAPLPFKIIYSVLALAGLMLGIYMVVGAIALLRRRRSGVTMLRHWALLRVMLVLVAAVVSIFTVETSMAFQKANVEMANARFIEAGMNNRVKPIPTDAELHRQVMMQTAITSGLVTIYPVALGFYLTRRKIADDVANWV